MDLRLMVAATASQLAGYCGAAAAVGGGLVGLMFRGAAAAWRDERDAALDKAERFEATVRAQADQIATLESKVAVLEQRTDYDAYAERSGREHKQIVDAISELARGLNANTTAVEFLLKQVFPVGAHLTER
jgi:hypothetical protein